jgi:hypothetical protein
VVFPSQCNQLANSTTFLAFPPHAVAAHVLGAEDSVEIRDPWSGPKTYAEDYYSGGDIHEKPEELTADHLGAGDEGETPTKRDEPPEDKDIIDVDEATDKDPEEVQPLSEDTCTYCTLFTSFILTPDYDFSFPNT